MYIVCCTVYTLHNTVYIQPRETYANNIPIKYILQHSMLVWLSQKDSVRRFLSSSFFANFRELLYSIRVKELQGYTYSSHIKIWREKAIIWREKQYIARKSNKWQVKTIYSEKRQQMARKRKEWRANVLNVNIIVKWKNIIELYRFLHVV